MVMQEEELLVTSMMWVENPFCWIIVQHNLATGQAVRYQL